MTEKHRILFQSECSECFFAMIISNNMKKNYHEKNSRDFSFKNKVRLRFKTSSN